MNDNSELEKAYKVLEGFQTADEVADYFRGLGIKAVPDEADRCPVSEYMRQNGANSSETLTYQGMYSVEEEFTINENWEYVNIFEVVEHPIHITEFIRGFDNGIYPDLEIQ